MVSKVIVATLWSEVTVVTMRLMTQQTYVQTGHAGARMVFLAYVRAQRTLTIVSVGYLTMLYPQQILSSVEWFENMAKFGEVAQSPISRYSPGGDEENHENFSSNSWCPGWRQKRALVEDKSQVLSPTPAAFLKCKSPSLHDRHVGFIDSREVASGA
jgi:hypothetical protein